MTLENLTRIGKLKRHVADKLEIARLLDSAESAIRDASIEELSAASRLARIFHEGLGMMARRVPSQFGLDRRGQ